MDDGKVADALDHSKLPVTPWKPCAVRRSPLSFVSGLSSRLQRASHRIASIGFGHLTDSYRK